MGVWHKYVSDDGVQRDLGGRKDTADARLWELPQSREQRSAPPLLRQRAPPARSTRDVRATDRAHAELVPPLHSVQRLEPQRPDPSSRQQRPALLLTDRGPGAALAPPAGR